MPDNNKDENANGTVALCASCDRCRARKTKCDGNRPCSNCAAKYMKKHKVDSIEGVDLELFGCVYSPAKRRGPVPGKIGQTRKANEALDQTPPAIHQSQMQLNQNGGSMDELISQQQRQILLQQAQQQPTNQLFSNAWNPALGDRRNDLNQVSYMQMSAQHANQFGDGTSEPLTRKPRQEHGVDNLQNVSRTVIEHLPLLKSSNSDGNRLRSYYAICLDDLFCLPPIPSDDDFLSRLPRGTMGLPKYEQMALQACRFAELALGALINNQLNLAMELSNATVMSLRECTDEPLYSSTTLELARAYMLLGLFRSFRGDMARYFKYRRICLRHLSKLDKCEGIDNLLAAISFHDSWAYMMHNASDANLPDAHEMPPIGCGSGSDSTDPATKEKYGVSTCASRIASDPNNQNWIQGPPPVFLNNEAPAISRCLDALACAVRSCCDQANQRFDDIAREGNNAELQGASCGISLTTAAVTANENELCSRNMILSAFTLLQHHEIASATRKSQSMHILISAMDAFLEGGDEDEPGGFTDSQIQSLLAVCNAAVEKPLILHQGGPTYHMVTNAAIMLCHLLNGLHSNRMSGLKDNGEMEAALFEEILDTLLAVRKLLNIHRRKLPVRLRCHGIPRPNLALLAGTKPGNDPECTSIFSSSGQLIDLGDTLMCGCRGCQGFVLMACSPCVAAERALAAKRNIEADAYMEDAMNEGGNSVGWNTDLLDVGDFDVEDDALLSVLSKVISQ